MPRQPYDQNPCWRDSGHIPPQLSGFFVCLRGLINSSSLHWRGVPADHALICAQCTPVFEKRRAAKTRWKCIDTDGCVAWLRARAPEDFADISFFHALLLEAQEYWGNRQLCRDRRVERVPRQLRDLYSRAADATYILAPPPQSPRKTGKPFSGLHGFI